MKVKDIERTANIAWSPANHHPIYLAAGTAAQQLDASFSTNAALEIYSLNLSEPGLDTELKVNVPSEHRFHKIVWGPYPKDQTSGTIVGGCDKGVIQIYNVSKLFSGENGLVATTNKHNGPVHALDFNPFQGNLLATGASESEIYIWDLNNTTTPMTPGVKPQPFEDVVGVAWNKQVQHILASTFTSKCVVWDLRKNEPIIKLTDTVSRIRWKIVAWHPEIATQLSLASEEDHAPIIQLWDLRFATSPLKTLENHQRGILSLAWCQNDSDLLVSCAKDDRILCWNPNSNSPNGEVLGEIAKTNQWNFDVAWCNRNPALIACSNYDGHVTVYSLLGGKTTQVQTSKKIADSFPGMDGYVEAPVMQESVTCVYNDLSKPPKWFKRPIGACFGFGGKLITFENNTALQSQNNQQPGTTQQRRTVFVSQVVTEENLVQKSEELEKALEYGNYSEYCKNKADSLNDQHKRYIWYFLKAYFEENTRSELLNLLGYKAEDVNGRLSQFTEGSNFNNDIDGLTDQLSNINNPSSLDATPHNQSSPVTTRKTSGVPFKIKTGDDTDGLITQALLLGNTEAAVELCFRAKRYADAIIIAMTGGPDLLARTQYRYFKISEGYVSSLISAIVSEDWSAITTNCDVTSWKEALVALLTHSANEDLPALCEQLAYRLEEESRGDPKLLKDAQLCYICAGDFERLVASWSDLASRSSENLQELVELVTFLQKAVERQGRNVEISGKMAELLSTYAMLLASQGRLATALNYLGISNDEKVKDLRDRLHVALGKKPILGGQRARISVSGHLNQNPNYGYTSSSNQYPTSAGFGSGSGTTAPVSYNQFNTGMPNMPSSQPWQTQPQLPIPPPTSAAVPPPKPFSPAPPVGPPQPPRPGSVGSVHGDSGLRSKSKYLLDPSVKPSNPYMTPNSYGSNQFPSSTPFNSSNFQTDALANASSSSLYGQPSSFYSNSGPFSSPAPSVPAPVPNLNPVPLNPTGYNAHAPISNQPTMGGAGDHGFGQPEIAQPAVSALNSLPPTAAPGWNDPPALNKSSRLQQTKKSDLPNQNPITHPLYGSAPVQQQQFPSNSTFMNSPQPMNPYGASSTAPQSFPPPQGGVFDQTPSFAQHQQNPAPFSPQPPLTQQNNFNNTQQPFVPNFNTHAIDQSNSITQNAGNGMVAPSFVGFPQQQQSQQISVTKQPEPVQKPPIPEEHKEMKEVFDELRNRCSCIANNPQTKRKLEEVSKKLEVLYDLLREKKLSVATLESLHEMIRLIEGGDYISGLQLHTQLVSGPDFSQIASFMPGLKVLLQCAMQLQVFLR